MAPRILFVDDEHTARKAFANLIRKDGYDVLEAENGRAAIEQLDQKSVDLLITDMIMPEMDGVQTILAVRSRFPAVKIIALAEHRITPAENSLKIARALGSHKTLVKPFTPVELLGVIRELVG